MAQSQHVEAKLNEVGIFPRPEWLRACLNHHQEEHAGFASLPADEQAYLCVADFLESDMNTSAAGRLPPNLAAYDKDELKGKYVLQVDEAVDIGCAPQVRYKDHPSSCLKLSLTDGEQRAYAMEYRKVPQLNWQMPAGIKVALSNVYIRKGLLLLCPDNIEVLGGRVQHLEEARVRVMDRWNQPPRGRRTPLNQRAAPTNYRDAAAEAAWPRQEEHPNRQNGTADGAPAPAATANERVPAEPNHIARQGRSNIQASNAEMQIPQPLQERPNQSGSRTTTSSNPLQTTSQRPVLQRPPDQFGSQIRASSEGAPHFRASLFERTQMSQPQAAPQTRASSPEGTRRPWKAPPAGQQKARVLSVNGASSIGHGRQQPPASQKRAQPDIDLASESDGEEEGPLRVARRPRAGMLTEGERGSQDSPDGVERPTVDGSKHTRLETAPLIAKLRMSVKARPSAPVTVTPPPVRTVEVIDLASPGMDVDNDDVIAMPAVATDADALPFSYLEDILRKRDGLPEGAKLTTRVKCILTGVKEFDFRRGSTYLLKVHIEDGSAICECTVASEAVEELVGHAAPNVCVALRGDNEGEKQAMKAKMKQVQHYFTTFEGIVDLEVVKKQMPTVVKLHSGISDGDGWKLLQRLQVQPG